ncbi:hypothetical protein [Demequina sp. NBRC 110052]|uniref:hypothetical protein n=1 Tax=Demequina sp. NBRC 110052 TaxID=1570341 RepID=UPI000A05EA4F|nr:hypothetical protein [Demequina sp. NBRC 110052]
MTSEWWRDQGLTERAYGAEEVFFSTTDRRGVIESVNSTFVRLSRFAAVELLGQPHNIIRHPAMPGGAFRIMWDRLLSGQSMVAYVVNKAKDDAYYRTFSTVTPLGDGFLSVRSAAMRPDLWGPVEAAYEETRRRELRWRDEGLSRAEAARLGADDLQARLSALGFDTYDDVIRTLLPAEVEARRAAAPPHPPVTDPADPLHALVSAIRDVDAALDALLARYSTAAQMAEELAAGRDRLEAGIVELVAAAGAAAAAAATADGAAPALATSARGAVSLAEAVSDDVAPLGAVLAQVRTAVLDLRAGLALSVLHADMCMIFAGEVHSGEAVGDPARSVQELARALAESVTSAERMITYASRGLEAAAERVEAADGRLREFQRLLAGWRNLVVRAGLSEALGPRLGPIDARLNGGLTEMARLAALAKDCRAMAAPVDTREAAEAVARLSATASAL